MCARQRVECLIILLLMISLASGCSSKEESAQLFGKYYRLPDKIIVYRQGDKEEIDEGDRLYHQIIQVLNQMFAEAKDIDNSMLH